MDFAYHFYLLVEKEIAKKIDALSADAASMKVTWNALLISLLSYIISYLFLIMFSLVAGELKDQDDVQIQDHAQHIHGIVSFK